LLIYKEGNIYAQRLGGVKTATTGSAKWRTNTKVTLLSSLRGPASILTVFIPEIRISDRPPVAYTRLKTSRLFTTKEEAETQGFEIAKRWIDSLIKTNGAD
jgi:hypothetical protein